MRMLWSTSTALRPMWLTQALTPDGKSIAEFATKFVYGHHLKRHMKSVTKKSDYEQARRGVEGQDVHAVVPGPKGGDRSPFPFSKEWEPRTEAGRVAFERREQHLAALPPAVYPYQDTGKDIVNKLLGIAHAAPTPTLTPTTSSSRIIPEPPTSFRKEPTVSPRPPLQNNQRAPSVKRKSDASPENEPQPKRRRLTSDQRARDNNTSRGHQGVITGAFQSTHLPLPKEPTLPPTLSPTDTTPRPSTDPRLASSPKPTFLPTDPAPPQSAQDGKSECEKVRANVRGGNTESECDACGAGASASEGGVAGKGSASASVCASKGGVASASDNKIPTTTTKSRTKTAQRKVTNASKTSTPHIATDGTSLLHGAEVSDVPDVDGVSKLRQDPSSDMNAAVLPAEPGKHHPRTERAQRATRRTAQPQKTYT